VNPPPPFRKAFAWALRRALEPSTGVPYALEALVA